MWLLFVCFICLSVCRYVHKSGVTARTFLSIDKYVHANRWADLISQRPAVVRGMSVCAWGGVGKPWLEKKAPDTVEEEGKDAKK